MALYIVQHGASLSKSQDPQKGLSPEGRKGVERIAQVVAGYSVPVKQIQHSGKTRAAQTARIFGDYLSPKRGIQIITGINPMDDVTLYASTLDLANDLMVVGHLPFLERLISYLVTGQMVKPVFRMQNGGVVCLNRYPESKDVVIQWAIMPNIP